VEADPEELFGSVVEAGRRALAAAASATASATAGAAGGAAASAVALANQGETVLGWDRRTGRPLTPAIVWQDRRSAGVCARLADRAAELTALTGLPLDPYFAAPKMTWLRENLTADGVVTTTDTWLLHRLGAGYVTDAATASRTLLLDLDRAAWSETACAAFGLDPAGLPAVTDCAGVVGETAAFGGSLPVAGIAVDQQAALLAEGCLTAGDAKCTYGTGSFVLVNTGPVRPDPGASLLATVAWMDPEGVLSYALEGSVFVTGAAVQWLRDGLGLLDNAAQSEALARSVPDSGGVVFVPALTGLGAPDWDPDARGAIFGITRGTSRAHLVRATLEAIAFEVRDVCGAMAEASSARPRALKADGGASENDLLMQLQADQLGLAVERPVIAETTALGAGFLAGLATGVWSSTAELSQIWRLGKRFSPAASRDDAAYARWRTAVTRAKGWASAASPPPDG
jgi:glycerol kinase